MANLPFARRANGLKPKFAATREGALKGQVGVPVANFVNTMFTKNAEPLRAPHFLNW